MRTWLKGGASLAVVLTSCGPSASEWAEWDPVPRAVQLQPAPRQPRPEPAGAETPAAPAPAAEPRPAAPVAQAPRPASPWVEIWRTDPRKLIPPGAVEAPKVEVVDENDPMALGRNVFSHLCAACHQADAKGLPGAFPPLAASDFLMADKGRSIRVVSFGLSGPVTVNGVTYTNLMPPQTQLSDKEVASVLTFVRASFGNKGEPVTVKEVAEVRARPSGPVTVP